MSNVADGYRTYLLTKSTVTDVLGTTSGIFHDNAPQGVTYPIVVLHKIDDVPVQALDGPIDKARALVQVDCRANTRAAADNLGEQIRLVTDNYSGTMGTHTVTSAVVIDKRATALAPKDGSELFVRVMSLDIALWHTEATPTT